MTPGLEAFGGLGRRKFALDRKHRADLGPAGEKGIDFGIGKQVTTEPAVKGRGGHSVRPETQYPARFGGRCDRAAVSGAQLYGSSDESRIGWSQRFPVQPDVVL